MVPPSSHGIPRVPWYFGSCRLSRSFIYATLTLSGMLSHTLRLDLKIPFTVRNPNGISTVGLASSAFARHFLFLALLRCFSSGGSPHTPMDSVYDAGALFRRIAPFGHLRIISYLLIPAAFRSLSRPSSAPSAKAFTLRSF